MSPAECSYRTKLVTARFRRFILTVPDFDAVMLYRHTAQHIS